MTAIGHTRPSLAQLLAIIAIILTVVGLMLGMVRPADARKRVGVILGILILLVLGPNGLTNLWSEISLWQWICPSFFGIVVWQWRRRRRRAPQKKAR